jgi:hypothetical protein
LKQVKKSSNHYIAIFAVIALIGILFVPAVSGGTIINYGPIQGTMKIIHEVNYIPTPAVVTSKIFPFTTPSPIVTPAADPSYISKEEAIRIALKSVNNISLTTDPVATLTSQRVTYDFRGNEYTLKKTVWVVTLSGVSTDPNAIGVKQWFNTHTGEIIDVPIHANRWVTVDAITGWVVSVERCW